jgi:hypothetical protein
MEKKKIIRQGVSGGRKWVKPKLIVITRGDQQERVLCACKGPGGNGPDLSGPGGCMVDYAIESCTSLVSS